MRYTLDKACASFAGDVCAIATKADGSQSVGALVGGDAL
jgi:hypothetical protein